MSQTRVANSRVGTEQQEDKNVVPAEVYPYSAGLVGGFLGGLAMALVAALTGLLMGKGPWFPLNLVGATVVRQLQGVPDEVLQQFDFTALAIGFVLHIQLSLLIGLLFTLLMPALPGPPLAWSVVLGPAMWFWAQFVFVPVLNPRMSEALSTPSFFLAHMAYALVLGWSIWRTPKIRAGYG